MEDIMIDPEYVAGKIAIYEAQIERLKQQIKELLWSPICNEKGEIVLYQDYQDSLDN